MDPRARFGLSRNTRRGVSPAYWRRLLCRLVVATTVALAGRTHASQVDARPVNAAAERGDAAALVELSQDPAAQPWPYGDTSLRLALQSRCAACVRVLLDAGAPFPANDADALGSGYPSWFDLLARAEPATLRLFVHRGLRLRARDAQGDSLLHAAATAGSATTVRWLVQQKLPLNMRDARGQTPLMVAASVGNLPAARELLAGGAAIGLHDQFGQTAKQLAAQAKHPDMVALLQVHGAGEFLGTALPSTFHDPGLAGRQQSDATGAFYTRLPFLPAGLRFFAATPPPPAAPATIHLPVPGPVTSPPASPRSYYMVDPSGHVAKLDRPDVLAVPGLRLRSAANALQFVRVLTATEPYDALLDPAVAGLGLAELPTTTVNNCLAFDARILRRIGAAPPRASASKEGSAFRIIRYMKPLGWPGFGQTLALPTVYRVVEQVDTRGRYTLLERHPIRTPHLVLRNVCGYR